MVVMHIHFGMSGRFRVSPLPGPEATATTRLQLTSKAAGVVANLSAMTVAHGDLGTLFVLYPPWCALHFCIALGTLLQVMLDQQDFMCSS